jgi:C_GCAxxG_C_C family probable redox protein
MLAGFGQLFELDRETALKVGRSFGSGMGRGLTCGAVTGAFMVLGLSRGAVEKDDRGPRYAAYDRCGEFVSRFEARRGNIGCGALLGVDMGTKEGAAAARERKLFIEVCPGVVGDAADILAEMLGEIAGG